MKKSLTLEEVGGAEWMGPVSPVTLAKLVVEAEKRFPNRDIVLDFIETSKPEEMTSQVLAHALALAVSPMIFHIQCLRALYRRATWERGVLLHTIERDGENDPWIKRHTMAQKALELYRTYYPNRNGDQNGNHRK